MNDNEQAELSSENCITTFMHCKLCLAERPDDVSPREFASMEVGFTKEGVQVWCRRHECNIMHIDFQVQRHPANTGRQKTG